MTQALRRGDRRSDRAIEIAADPQLLARSARDRRRLSRAPCHGRRACRLFRARDAPIRTGAAATSRCRTSRRCSIMSRIAAACAPAIGAINTVVRAEDGALIGTNTDAGGFYAPLADLDLDGQRHVAVIGTGGAARAILFALSRIGVGPVTILTRNRAEGGGAARRASGSKGDALPLGARAAAGGAARQRQPARHDRPAAARPRPVAAARRRVVYDIVYAPLETAAACRPRARADLDTIDGLDMLIGQAAIAFELFFGAAPPRERDAELRALLTRMIDARPHRLDRHGQVDRRGDVRRRGRAGVRRRCRGAPAAGPGRRAGRGDRGACFPARPGRRASTAPRSARRCSAIRAALARLEAIVHPAVGDERSALPARATRDAPLVVLDIPLLFEKGGWREVDAIVVVSAPAEVQRARVLARPGHDRREIRRRSSRCRCPTREKRARADFVIETGAPLAETRAAGSLAVIACLQRRTESDNADHARNRLRHRNHRASDPPSGDRLVEIGCVELVNRVETGRTFHAYFNPERADAGRGAAVHGLSDAFLSDKPLFAARRRGSARVPRRLPAGRAQCRASTSASSTASSALRPRRGGARRG